jgi:hypothetical protein
VSDSSVGPGSPGVATLGRGGGRFASHISLYNQAANGRWKRVPIAFLDATEHDVVHAVAGFVACNPFLPDRVELERRVLGDAFVASAPVWHAEDDTVAGGVNAERLRPLVETLGTRLQHRLAAGARAGAAELADYHAIVLYLLFYRYEDQWLELIDPPASAAEHLKRVGCYEQFAADVDHFFAPAAAAGSPPPDAAHLFALGYQGRRAFHHIYRQIFGGSQPAARLRAAVWQSIFTHDVRYYREDVYDRMADVPTLITGESGTGKELVARAIGRSGYVPFDAPTHTFAAGPGAGFYALNISTLSPSLIEAELFGHRRGAFTGADADRVGWLETCGPHGAVFLDEIGELKGDIQVKLLRVLQSRELQRVGETQVRSFAGKVIAATNRDLEVEMANGRFREDLYYRICADQITTPTLREQLADRPDDMPNLLRIAAAAVVSPAKAGPLAAAAQRWVERHLPADYPWLGNMRELEQCVRSILVRGEYRPRVPASTGGGADVMCEWQLTADELLQRYCAAVYARTGSYLDTARRLGLDRRTVCNKVAAWHRRPLNGAAK